MSNSEFNPTPGHPDRLADGLVRVLAPNPSPMTFRGTNSYILGHHRLTVIDPGPSDKEHLAALLTVIDQRHVEQIIVTHSHLDHSPLSAALSRQTGAPIMAFGNSFAGRSAAMTQLAQSSDLAGGGGIDASFHPDHILKDNDTVSTDAGDLRALHTPGHLGNHICLHWNNALFTGDHVMGWASSLVSPPDGDVTDFMASCHRLLTVPATVLYPGHGAPVTDPGTTISALISHRQNREAQILAALSKPLTPAEITASVYTDAPPGLAKAAERNVLAHLIDLTGRGLVSPVGTLSATARFARQNDVDDPMNFSNTTH